MIVSVNAQKIELEKSLLLSDLVAKLGYQGPGFVVAVNWHCVPRSEYGRKWIEDGDEIEILSAQAGG